MGRLRPRVEQDILTKFQSHLLIRHGRLILKCSTIVVGAPSVLHAEFIRPLTAPINNFDSCPPFQIVQFELEIYPAKRRRCDSPNWMQYARTLIERTWKTQY